jgi:hypothetical protein
MKIHHVVQHRWPAEPPSTVPRDLVEAACLLLLKGVEAFRQQYPDMSLERVGRMRLAAEIELNNRTHEFIAQTKPLAQTEPLAQREARLREAAKRWGYRLVPDELWPGLYDLLGWDDRPIRSRSLDLDQVEDELRELAQ